MHLDYGLEAIMRMMLRFTLPVEKGNQAFNDGSLGRTMESIMSKLKPEAAYFAPLDGKRSGKRSPHGSPRSAFKVSSG
jgi:hypothetical protein